MKFDLFDVKNHRPTEIVVELEWGEVKIRGKFQGHVNIGGKADHMRVRHRVPLKFL